MILKFNETFKLQKQKERGSIHVDVDRFTNEQMERMIFDKDYNPLKKPEGAEGPSDDEEDHEGLALKISQFIFYYSFVFI